MNFNQNRSTPRSCRQCWRIFELAVLIAGVGLTTPVRAQTDDFDDGNDTGWSKVTVTNYPATYSFPSNDFGGKAYRLQAGAIDPSDIIAGASPAGARAIAYRPERIYGNNFYVAADLVAWDASYTNNQVFGLIARASNIGSGLFNAVTLTVRINHVPDAAGSRGRAQIWGFSAGGLGGFVAQDFCTLVPGRKYRFVLSGTNNILAAAVYDLEDLTRPLTSMSGDGVVANLFGLPLPDPSLGGYSGIFSLSLIGSDPTTDATFDNFVASEFPPTSVAAPGTPHGQTGAPQVVNRSPASFANFYPSSSGVTFNATTLTTTNAVNTGAIKLYLNGVNVSSSLNISGFATNAAVAYNGLASNVLYEARIELEDVLGWKTTNAWTFDTFTDAYLASSRAKNIECEDYDFGDGVNDGLFIDNPPPSGYATNDTNHDTPFNGSGVGYLDLDGSNAKLGGVDYYDYDNSLGNVDLDFRFFDTVGTQLGTITGYYSDGNDPSLTPFKRSFDTQRQKYFNVNSNLFDYVVERTEGGEWLNYTRVFTNASFYNVYLRYNSGLAQPLSLDRIGAGPTTNNLGTFAVQGSSALGNYRYAPMLDDSGRLAVVNLAGTNTLRLTMSAPQSNITKHSTGLNYLAFVPALVVESAAQAGGPYTIETTAVIEPVTRRITVPTGGSARFYRLGWDHAASITSVKLVGGNVELTYQ